jgi:LysR family glycine cleavage system transcriptional activator
VDAGEPAEGSSFNDIGLMCDAAAQGWALRWCA